MYDNCTFFIYYKKNRYDIITLSALSNCVFPILNNVNNYLIKYRKIDQICISFTIIVN